MLGLMRELGKGNLQKCRDWWWWWTKEEVVVVVVGERIGVEAIGLSVTS